MYIIVCVSADKNCSFFGTFCVHTKWMTPNQNSDHEGDVSFFIFLIYRFIFSLLIFSHYHVHISLDYLRKVTIGLQVTLRYES